MSGVVHERSLDMAQWRLHRVEWNDAARFRVWRGGQAAFLPATCVRLRDAVQLLRTSDAWEALVWSEGERLRHLAPLEEGASVVFCVGKNYRSHVGEVDSAQSLKGITKGEAPEDPIIFTKSSRCVIGPEDAIPYPHGATEQLDYEGELVVVIGKEGKDIQPERAWDHVFGFTVANDVTARDAQRRHQQWHVGKSMDGFCPMGPDIVPKEFLMSDHGVLDFDIVTKVNGEVRQSGNAKEMIFAVPEILATISKGFTLQAGDVVLTGTPAGVGAGMKPPCFLKPGDVVEVTIDGIGTITNQVM